MVYGLTLLKWIGVGKKGLAWVRKYGSTVAIWVLVAFLVLTFFGYLKAREAEKTARLRVSELETTNREVEKTNRHRISEIQESFRAQLKARDVALHRARLKNMAMNTEMQRAKFYDAKTGNLIADIEQAKSAKTELDTLLSNVFSKPPTMAIPDPAMEKPRTDPSPATIPSSPCGLYPVTLGVDVNDQGSFGAMLGWQLVPRVRLPFMPDPSLTIEGGAEKRGSDLGWRAGVELGLNRK